MLHASFPNCLILSGRMDKYLGSLRRCQSYSAVKMLLPFASQLTGLFWYFAKKSCQKSLPLENLFYLKATPAEQTDGDVTAQGRFLSFKMRSTSRVACLAGCFGNFCFHSEIAALPWIEEAVWWLLSVGEFLQSLFSRNNGVW